MAEEQAFKRHRGGRRPGHRVSLLRTFPGPKRVAGCHALTQTGSWVLPAPCHCRQCGLGGSAGPFGAVGLSIEGGGGR